MNYRYRQCDETLLLISKSQNVYHSRDARETYDVPPNNNKGFIAVEFQREEGNLYHRKVRATKLKSTGSTDRRSRIIMINIFNVSISVQFRFLLQEVSKSLFAEGVS